MRTGQTEGGKEMDTFRYERDEASSIPGSPRYRVYTTDGEYIGIVTRTREAVRPTGGSRIRSGRERTVWIASGHSSYGYSTRQEAAEALTH